MSYRNLSEPDPSWRRLHPAVGAAVVKPFIRKSTAPDEGWIFRPADDLFVSLMESSERSRIPAQVRMMLHRLFAIGGFYFFLKLW